MLENYTWYRTGLVTVLNGATKVTGIDTGWVKDGIKAGDIFILLGVMCEVDRVVTNTELELKDPYTGESITGTAYKIVRLARPVLSAEIALSLRELIDNWPQYESLVEAYTSLSEGYTELQNDYQQLSEKYQALNTKCDALTEEIVNLSCGGYKTILDIIIPANSWVIDETPSTDHKFICDIVNEEITSEMFPVGSSYLGSIGVSTAAGMICACETFNGYIRFYADEQPLSDIRAMVALFEKSNGHGGGGGGSEDVEAGDGLAWNTDGKLAVKIGNGLKFDENRAIAADPQKVFTDNDLLDEDATERDLKEILLSEQSQS